MLFCFLTPSNMPEQSAEKSSSRSYRETNEGRRGRSAIDRRRFLGTAGAGGVLALTAGCLGGDSTGDSASVPLANRDEIRIGVLASFPNENPIGRSIANGAELAAKQLNDGGGLDGTTVETIVKDTEQKPQAGRDAYGELIREEEVDMTTGIFTSEVALAIMDDMAGAQVPHITTGAAATQISDKVKNDYEKYKYHFRTGPLNIHHQGQLVLDFLETRASDIGWDSIAVLVEDIAGTEGFSAVLDSRLGELDIEVVMNERYSVTTEDFNPQYDRIENNGADAALVYMAQNGTAPVLQWAQQRRPFEFGGIHVPMQLPSYYEAVKGACAYGVTMNVATPTSEITGETVPYADAYNEEFGGYPVYTGYTTFDAVNQYVSVVQEGGDLGADAVVDGLESSSRSGTTGTVEFYGPDAEYPHDVKFGRDKVWHLFQQWQPDDPENPQAGGTQEVIYPDNVETASYQSPPWI